MKYIDEKDLDRIPGRRLTDEDTFCFRCHPAIGCFNKCCRNLNLFLYPYDVLRLKKCLQIDSDEFIERHVDVVLREGHYFPEVLLRMAENDERTCLFLSAEGCSVYAHRPDTCRTFPVEQGALFDAASGKSAPIYYFRPPDFCQGPREDRQWTVASWTRDQEAERYHRMTQRWAEIRSLFQNDPWGVEGPGGGKAKMAFMAAYNLDRFRDFLFTSTFFKRYRVKPNLKRKLRTSDQELMLFGFEWIKFFVWGIQSKQIRVK